MSDNKTNMTFNGPIGVIQTDEVNAELLRKAKQAGVIEGMQWMLKQLCKHVEISPDVLDRITTAYQDYLKKV